MLLEVDYFPRPVSDPCLDCGHDNSEHEDSPMAPCTLCMCEGLHFDVGDCVPDCYDNGLRFCDTCDMVDDAAGYPDWVNGMCPDCDPRLEVA